MAYYIVVDIMLNYINHDVQHVMKYVERIREKKLLSKEGIKKIWADD